MTDQGVEFPAGWTDDLDGGAASTLHRYRYEAGGGTAFVVSLHRWPSSGREYELRLSVVTPASAQVRHDYPVAEYGTEADALDDLYPFLEYVSEQVEAGRISATNPSDGEVRAMIGDFTRERSLPSVRRLVRRFRR